MRKVIALLLSVAVMIGLCTCNVVASEPAIINVAVAEEQTSLDNVIQTKDVALMIAQNVFETLYCYDSNFQIQPMLAESDTLSDDGMTATISLRKGVKFHDGSEMLAEDVVASFQRWLTHGVKGKAMGEYVASLEVIDDYSFAINFSKVYSMWKDKLAWFSGCWYVQPKQIIESAGENALTWEQNIGTGPFTFVEYAEGRFIKLSKFADYSARTEEPSAASGKREVFIDELYFHFVPDASTRFNGLQAGQYDYATAMPTDYYDIINGYDGLHTVSNATQRCLFMFLNSRSDLFSGNYLMKEAIATAVNAADCMGAAYGNPALWGVQTSWYPEGSIYHYENDIPWYNAGDPVKAAELAKEAGYGGQEIRVLVNTSYPAFDAALTVVVDNLRNAGFNVSDERMDNASLMSKRSDAAQWELFVTHHNYEAAPTGYNPLNPAYAGWWDTTERNVAVDKLVSSTTEEARVAAWREIMDLVAVQIPVVRLGSFTEIYAASDKLEGVGDTYYSYPCFWNITKSN